jgi:hypothetical protein
MVRFHNYYSEFLPRRLSIRISNGYHSSSICHKKGIFIQMWVGRWRPSMFIGIRDFEMYCILGEEP